MELKARDTARAELKIFRVDIQEALNSVAEKHGLKIDTGSCTYNLGQGFTMKIEASLINEDGTVMSKEAKTFLQFAHLLGMPEDLLGQTFVQRGEEYTLKGYNPRARKFPFLADNAKGETYKFTEEAIRMHFKIVRD